VLTYRFWRSSLKSDPSVIGKTVRLGERSATIVGVLEPSIPYPAETEIIANVVTSPHHLSATMVTGRVHRMTELFGKLAPGATLDQARNELRTVYASMVKDHPDSYPTTGGYRIDAKMLRDEITSGARTVLLVLLVASGLVFIIACSNVANLILARTVRREGELAIRAALGASSAALRRMLLAESLLLCGAGAALGVMSAQPLVSILARDGRLPFAASIARVHGRSKTPLVPSVVIGVLTLLLLVLNVGNQRAFFVLTSVAIVMFYLAYLCVTGPLLIARLRGRWPSAEHGPYFSLGRWGLVINLLAVIFQIGVMVNLAWPRVAVYGGGAWYFQWGAFTFTGGLGLVGVIYYLVKHQGRETSVLAEHRPDTTLAAAGVSDELT